VQRATTDPGRRPNVASTTHWSAGAGTLLLVLTTATTAAAVLLDLRVPSSHRELIGVDPGWTGGLPGLALAAAGSVVLAADRRNTLGWLLGGFGLWWAIDGTAAAWLSYATMSDPALPGASWAFWVFQRLGAGLLLLLPLVLLLYPAGRLPSGRWRTASLVSLATTAVLPVVLLTAPSEVAQETTGAGAMPAPLAGLDLDLTTVPVPGDVTEVLLRAAFVAVSLSLVVPFLVVVRRYRSAEGLLRTRMRWLLWAAVVDLLLMLTVQALPLGWGSAGLLGAVVATAGSVAIGIARPDVVDVDRLLGGTAVYGALLVTALLVDLLVLGGAGLVGASLDSDQGMVVAVFVVALLYTPFRHRLWRLARRWVVGERDDPYRVVSGLAERLERSGESEAQLLLVAETVARAFRSPYVGVEINQVSGERLLAEHGPRPSTTRALPIAYRGEEIGHLLLPRDSDRPARLSAADERLLADVVRQAAAAARADHLATALQESRERMVTAVEDERRRLRRDLHDGLGPSLAAVASRIDTARIVAARSPEEADRVLARAREEVGGMLAEVRRLVHGLRPPSLDDIGLTGAIRQLVERLQSPGLRVEVVERGDMSALPAAVEVAAYRIVSEALSNVVRHAAASACTVALTRTDNALVVDVSDDGRGIPGEAAAGVGLVSLRERAAELGGRCRVAAAPTGGTWVNAVLPLHDAHVRDLPAGAPAAAEGAGR
jgi:signal transduction histidine kinase